LVNIILPFIGVLYGKIIDAVVDPEEAGHTTSQQQQGHGNKQQLEIITLSDRLCILHLQRHLVAHEFLFSIFSVPFLPCLLLVLSVSILFV
jgi:hypothetical protein